LSGQRHSDLPADLAEIDAVPATILYVDTDASGKQETTVDGREPHQEMGDAADVEAAAGGAASPSKYGAS